jgi:flagellar biosynthetic protein FliR
VNVDAPTALQAVLGLQPAAIILVLARVTPLFILAPIFSGGMIPARVRGLIAVALAVGLTSVALGDDMTVTTAPVAYFELLVKELLVGTAFAFGLACLLAGFQAAGALLDIQIGYAFGATVDPVTGSQGAVIANLYSMVGVAILVAINGDAMILSGLARTYDLVGLTEFPVLKSLVSGTFEAFAGIFVAALAVVAPVMLTLLLTDAAFGLVSRVVPQMNIFAVGFPAKVVVGMLMIIVTLPFAAGWFSDRLGPTVAAALRSLQVAP